MDLYVNPTITDFRQDVNGDIKMLKIGQKKEDAWANIAEQSGKKLDNNKTATINVSTYTEPVEILPTSGKDGMKKATVTLSNIPSPSGGIQHLYVGMQGDYLAFLYDSSKTAPTLQEYNAETQEWSDVTVSEVGGLPANIAMALSSSLDKPKVKVVFDGDTYVISDVLSNDFPLWWIEPMPIEDVADD